MAIKCFVFKNIGNLGYKIAHDLLNCGNLDTVLGLIMSSRIKTENMFTEWESKIVQI